MLSPFIRQLAPVGETKAERKKRAWESQVWEESIQQQNGDCRLGGTGLGIPAARRIGAVGMDLVEHAADHLPK
ncbi:hypothetical protein KSC_040700 [Ktedonobacter sp. SOSP1-52]|nr:hypothetical protein KSC_040700 [Ktedonobacter sp. SOSP1-52]